MAGVPQADSGAFHEPLLDDRRRRLLDATTTYTVRHRFDGFSLLELQLVTGRKHQLRRHLANAELPVVGDERYGPRRPKRVPGFPGRLWLHAWKMAIPHRVIEAPLPSTLAAHLDLLVQPHP